MSSQALPFITGKQLKCICPALSEVRADELARLHCRVLPRYKMDDRDVFHEFISNLAVECRQFLTRNENLNYKADQLLLTFPKYFKGDLLAKAYAHQPEKIANYVYANRYGNGNAASGDGWKYRGGGDIQLTFHDIWKAYADYLKKPIDEVLDLVRNTDEYALDSACWYFAIYKKLIPAAIADDMDTVILRINGGNNGRSERLEFLKRAKACMPL